MKYKDIFNTDAYKALFVWTEPKFDEDKLCYFKTAGNQFGFFELNWVEGGTVVCILDGIEMSEEDDMESAYMYCFGVFQGIILGGLSVMMAIHTEHGAAHERGEWNKPGIRAFCLDQSGGAFDAFEEKNFKQMLDNMRSMNYTEDTDEVEQAGHFKVEAVKPTLH